MWGMFGWILVPVACRPFITSDQRLQLGFYYVTARQMSGSVCINTAQINQRRSRESLGWSSCIAACSRSWAHFVVTQFSLTSILCLRMVAGFLALISICLRFVTCFTKIQDSKSARWSPKYDTDFGFAPFVQDWSVRTVTTSSAIHLKLCWWADSRAWPPTLCTWLESPHAPTFHNPWFASSSQSGRTSHFKHTSNAAA